METSHDLQITNFFCTFCYNFVAFYPTVHWSNHSWLWVVITMYHCRAGHTGILSRPQTKGRILMMGNNYQCNLFFYIWTNKNAWLWYLKKKTHVIWLKVKINDAEKNKNVANTKPRILNLYLISISSKLISSAPQCDHYQFILDQHHLH